MHFLPCKASKNLLIFCRSCLKNIPQQNKSENEERTTNQRIHEKKSKDDSHKVICANYNQNHLDPGISLWKKNGIDYKH